MLPERSDDKGDATNVLQGLCLELESLQLFTFSEKRKFSNIIKSEFLY
jgi:hypothetical protein